MKNIFIHGLGQTPSSWEKTIAAMTGVEDCLCPDLTQFLHDKEAIYANLYQAFFRYCAEFEESVNLCGLSLGGILALQYTIENPEKVNSLVLVGTQYVMPKRLLKFQNMVFHVMPDKAFQETGVYQPVKIYDEFGFQRGFTENRMSRASCMREERFRK